MQHKLKVARFEFFFLYIGVGSLVCLVRKVFNGTVSPTEVI